MSDPYLSNDNPSIISHVSLGTRDMTRALPFYDAVMATIDAKRLEQIHTEDKDLVAVAYGKQFPEFWIQIPENNKPAGTGNGVHVAFSVNNRESVHRFYQAALNNGGTDNGEPGARPQYGAQFYGCFVFDPDGNKIEANFWDTSQDKG